MARASHIEYPGAIYRVAFSRLRSAAEQVGCNTVLDSAVAWSHLPPSEFDSQVQPHLDREPGKFGALPGPKGMISVENRVRYLPRQ